jgi:hypothetical protein
MLLTSMQLPTLLNLCALTTVYAAGVRGKSTHVARADEIEQGRTPRAWIKNLNLKFPAVFAAAYHSIWLYHF